MHKLKIDYISDLHCDFYIRDYNPQSPKCQKKLDTFVSILLPFQPNDILVVAGDLSHYNTLSIDVLLEFKKYYKYVIFTSGNHDLYLVNNNQSKKYNSSFKRIEELKILCNKNNIIFLDGDVIEINGVIIGGLPGWYNLPNDSDIYLWKSSMNDSRLIKSFNTQEYFHSQVKKLENIKADILISHVACAKIPNEFLERKYMGDPCNIFYHSDTLELLKNTGCKYHIFGHVHDTYNYVSNNINFVCNPLGYPSESRYITIKELIIKD